jgi:hypothetical protein
MGSVRRIFTILAFAGFDADFLALSEAAGGMAPVDQPVSGNDRLLATWAPPDRGPIVSRSVIDTGLLSGTRSFMGTACAILRGKERIGLPDSNFVALSLCRLSRAK